MEKYGYLKKHEESWEWSLCKVDMRAIWSHFLGISVYNDTWTWLPRFFFIQSPVPLASFMFGIVSLWFLRAVWLCSPSRFIGHGIWLVCSDLKLVKHVSGEDQCFALGRNCSDWTGSFQDVYDRVKNRSRGRSTARIEKRSAALCKFVLSFTLIRI